MKPRGGFSMQLQQDAARFNLSIFGATRAALLDHRNPNTRCELAHRRGKIDMLVIHHKAEDASSHAACEAVEGLSLRAHVKRRRFLLMEWAHGLEICLRRLQGNRGTTHLDAIGRRGDLFDGLGWDCSHNGFDFSLVWPENRCQNYAVYSR